MISRASIFVATPGSTHSLWKQFEKSSSCQIGHEQWPSSCFALMLPSIGNNFSHNSQDVDNQISYRPCIHDELFGVSSAGVGVDVKEETCL